MCQREDDANDAAGHSTSFLHIQMKWRFLWKDVTALLPVATGGTSAGPAGGCFFVFFN